MNRKESKSDESTEEARTLTRGRRIGFMLAALLLVPLLALGILEGSLRLAHFGYPTSFFLKRSENGREFLIENDKFGWRFFPKQLARSPGTLKFPVVKEPGAYRIFLFGESAALGDPKPAYGVGRYLGGPLKERFPGAKFEVITVAMTAINSHAIRAMARECADLNGDFWVVYMGNNEMAGPYGVNPIAGPSAPGLSTVRLSLAVRTTRIGQLLERLTSRFTPSGGTEWDGVKMFRERKVDPRDTRKGVIYDNFEANLRDIVKLGTAAGAKPILCTVASNQRDFAPFASTAGGQAVKARGEELQGSNLIREAAAFYSRALATNQDNAELHFRLGQVESELGSNTVARTKFQAARDLDALPLRADSELNGRVRKIAQENENATHLLDVDAMFGGGQVPQAPGDETFYDHVHFTFEGNYRLARMMAESIEKELPENVREKRAVNWAPAQICDRELALTDWNRRTAYENMMQRQMEPPFSDQSNHTNRMEGMALRIAELRNGLDARAAAEAQGVYEAALKRDENDFRLHENYAEFLELIGKLPAAAEQRIKVARIVPHDAVACYQAGRTLESARQHAEARMWLEQALNLRPEFPEAYLEIGRTYAAENKYDEALQSYAEALRLRANDARIMVQRAHALAASGKKDEAISELRRAVGAQPEYWEPRYLLGVELAARNQLVEAVAQFQEVVRLRPSYAQAHFNLAVALAKVGRLPEARTEFHRTLEFEPEHKLAREYFDALDRQLKSSDP